MLALKVHLSVKRSGLVKRSVARPASLAQAGFARRYATIWKRNRSRGCEYNTTEFVAANIFPDMDKDALLNESFCSPAMRAGSGRCEAFRDMDVIRGGRARLEQGADGSKDLTIRNGALKGNKKRTPPPAVDKKGLCMFQAFSQYYYYPDGILTPGLSRCA